MIWKIHIPRGKMNIKIIYQALKTPDFVT